MKGLARYFELGRGDDGQNVRSMEGLRGLAVFLVFLVHYVTLSEPWLASNKPLSAFTHGLHAAGNTGVDLFFVLSGYLIYGSLLAHSQPFLRFMKRRVLRIYPAFMVVFAVYIGLAQLFPAESRIPDGATEGALYLLSNFLLLPGLLPIEPLITVAWSLSYEMFYYLAIPLVIGLLRLRQRSRRTRMVFFAMLAAAILAWCAAFGGHVRLVMFVSGILLYELASSKRPPVLPAAVGAGALALGLLATLLPPAGPAGQALKTGIHFFTFGVLCLACFANPTSWLARGFSWTPLRWLGNMSYSYYLLHGLALKAAFLALSLLTPDRDFGTWFFWQLLPPMFFATLIPTALLFVVIERPLSLVRRSRPGGALRAAAVAVE